jgi:CheY-like chemotaxis protein
MNTSNWKVIVVEDTYDDQQLLSRMLAHYGIDVVIATNGNECLALLEQIKPTLIVTDLSMPIRDGWQTLIAIRARTASADIPVVAVTAYHSSDVARDVIKAGFDGYFAKPINPTTFVNQLADILIP